MTTTPGESYPISRFHKDDNGKVTWTFIEQHVGTYEEALNRTMELAIEAGSDVDRTSYRIWDDREDEDTDGLEHTDSPSESEVPT